MTYEEAARIMMSGTGEGGKAKEKTITENGAYAITDEEKAEGYVGYSPINVNVPTGGGSSETLIEISKLPTVTSITFGDFEFAIKKRENINAVYTANPTYPLPSADVSESCGNFNAFINIYYAILCKGDTPIISARISSDNQLIYYYSNKGNIYRDRIVSYQVSDFSISPFTVTNGGRVKVYYLLTTVTNYYDEQGNITNTNTTSRSSNMTSYVLLRD